MIFWRSATVGIFAAWIGIAAAQEPSAPESAKAILIDPRAVSTAFAEGLAPYRSDSLAAAALAVSASAVGRTCGGFTPISAAESESPPEAAAFGRFDLDTGLRRMIQGAEPATNIVVVANGPSQCLSVACALSGSLAARTHGLKIHVLALSGQASNLRCIAENTGGQFRLAGNTPLAGQIGALFDSAPALPVAVAPAEEGTAEAEPETETESEGSLATDAGSGDEEATSAATGAYDGPLPFPRFRPGTAAAIAQGGDPAPAAPFAWTTAQTAPEVEAPAESAAPGVQFRMLAGPNGPVIANDVSFEILRREGNGAYRLVGQSWAASPFMELPAGDFVARVAHGDVIREFAFSFDGKSRAYRTFALDIGYLSTSALPTAAAAPLEAGVVYTVSRLGGDASGAAVVVRREALPTIALPAGEYRVLAQAGSARAVADITVKAGETLRKAFVLNIGYLRVVAEGSEKPVTVRVESSGGGGGADPAVLGTATALSPLLNIPAGNHRLIASIDGRIIQQPVRITAGELTTVTLEAETAAEEPPLTPMEWLGAPTERSR